MTATSNSVARPGRMYFMVATKRERPNPPRRDRGPIFVNLCEKPRVAVAGVSVNGVDGGVSVIGVR
jgi:hypothetical protein